MLGKFGNPFPVNHCSKIVDSWHMIVMDLASRNGGLEDVRTSLMAYSWNNPWCCAFVLHPNVMKIEIINDLII